MALESNIQIMSRQAVTRLALAQQAVKTQQLLGLQTQATHSQFLKVNAHNSVTHQHQVQDPQILNAQNLKLQNAQSQNPQAKNIYAQNQQTQALTPQAPECSKQQLQALKPKNQHSMSEVNI